MQNPIGPHKTEVVCCYHSSFIIFFFLQTLPVCAGCLHDYQQVSGNVDGKNAIPASV